MDQKENGQDGTATYSYSHHMVAFLDLLGQRERIREIEGFLTSSERDEEKLLDVLRGTVGTIRHVRDSFSKFFDLYSNLPPSVPVPQIIEEQFNRLRGRSKINLQTFSDSIIAWTPVHLRSEVEHARVINGVHGILAATAMIIPHYLSLGIPIRGGIDVEGGITITPGGNDIYGPVLNRAYALESEIAKYPRVLIGKGLSKFLDFVSSSTHVFQDQIVFKYSQQMANNCKKWIVVDQDGHEMIHFLGPAVLELLRDMPEGREHRQRMFEGGMEFVLKCEKKFEGDEKLYKRYQLLKSYFDRHAREWRE